jgi:alkaline phosphatase D
MLRALPAALFAVAGCAALGEPTAPPALPAEREAASGILEHFPVVPDGPVLPTGAVSTILIASCINQDRPQPALERMAQEPADLAILMGDNVYGSSTPDDPLLSDLRAAYWRQSRSQAFAALVSSVPTLAIYDDHDFGMNDAGGETFAHRALALAMFQRFWRLPEDSPQRRADGAYGAYLFGESPGQRLQLIVLDTRFHRSPLRATDEPGAPGRERYLPDFDPTRTMLGADQWAWLEEELRRPADLRLIVSSVQVVAEGHGWERWGNFPSEQSRLYETIARSGASGVVFLSGDRHASAINRTLDGVAAYPLYDFTASSINMPWGLGGSETLPTMISPAYTQENFGVVRIDWMARRLTMELRGLDGSIVFSRGLSFAEIAAG